VSVKICLRPPLFGDARLWWCHRHLRGPAGYERGEGNAHSAPVVVGDPAGEQEPAGSPDALGSGRDAGVGWIEAETVRALDRSRDLVQPASQVQNLSRVATCGDSSSQAPAEMRGQRRRDEETPRFEVKGWVHRKTRVVDGRRAILAVTIAWMRVNGGGYGRHEWFSKPHL
jgi:hypothetical protein